MPSLSYSSKALDTLLLFHRKRYVVYVEGKDDRLFWNIILRAIGIDDFIIKIAGGVEEIEKYTRSVVDDDADIFLIRDCDYTDLFDIQVNHPRVLYTYSYSIENSLYCPRNISAAISIYSRTNDDCLDDAELWLEEFSEAFRHLIILDVANEKFGKGIEVLGDKCNRYLSSKRSHIPSDEKIHQKIANIREKFTKDELDAIENILKNKGKRLRYVIRGHFLTNAVINYIKHKSGLTSMSYDMLYGQMIAQLKVNYQENVEFHHAKKKLAYLLQ